MENLKKVGILGGGQLGRMLLQEAANYPVETWVMENDPDCPAAHLCDHFVLGDIRDKDAVLAFGRLVDALTIEIENVNVDALFQLEQEGLRIYPRPSALRTIKDKILQKNFYLENRIPTSPFHILQNKEELNRHIGFLPAVQKLGTGGYDGRGVQLLHKAEDFHKGFDAPSVLEKMVELQKEIAITVAINENGETAVYPSVEMIFDPDLNLLDYQLCPADIPENTGWKAEAMALAVARNLGSPGLFAVELFIDRSGDVWVNETAPRVHNSGHHTIEAHYSSQFDMLWRVILGFPLGNTKALQPSIMVNVLGSAGHSGPAHYEGIDEVLRMDQAFVHLYGKRETKPGRKMGHVTILGKDKSELLFQANKVKRTLKVISSRF
jgi:5-(carboxyamino)imidazole ribonucleotide synthase